MRMISRGSGGSQLRRWELAECNRKGFESGNSRDNLIVSVMVSTVLPASLHIAHRRIRDPSEGSEIPIINRMRIFHAIDSLTPLYKVYN